MLELMDRIKKFSDEHHTLCRILVFAIAVAMTVALSYSCERSIVYYNGDSPLYLSVADNFLDNGHFIQTHRSQFENFVVPPGYPMILTIIRFFTRSDAAVAVVQYLLFGLSSVLLYCSERNLFGNIGGSSVIVYCVMLWHKHYCAPGGLLTETWYISVVILCIWMLTRHDLPQDARLTAAFAASFAGVLIRPLLSVLFLTIAAYMLVLTVKRQYDVRKFAALAAAAVLIVGANIAVNYRETGHYILFEDYSGISVYLANNDVVKNEGLDFTKGEYDYADEQFLAIYNDESLDYYECNDQLTQLGNRYIITHPLTTLRNTVEKFWYMFFSYWYYIPLVSVLGAWLAYRYREKNKRDFTVILTLTLVLAVISSMGLYEPRYAYIAFPAITLFIAAAVEIGLRKALELIGTFAKNN